MSRIHQVGVFFLFFTSLLPQPIFAAPQAALADELSQALGEFIAEAKKTDIKNDLVISHRLGRIDPRLNVNSCATEVKVIPLADQWLRAHTSIRFECHDPSWAISLPVKFSAYTHAWHIKRTLKAHHILTPTDIYLKKIDTLKLFTGYFEKNNSPVGLKLSRSITQNSLLDPIRTEVPAAVKRNEKVIIVAKNKYIDVKSKGIALQDGVPGQQIRVRNISSQRIIVARVKSAGLVEVPL